MARARSTSPRAERLDPNKVLSIPSLEEKFRFKLPTNCHISKSITAALTHVSKIVETAQKREVDGDVSVEFGLHMNNGPIQDTISAHEYH